MGATGPRSGPRNEQCGANTNAWGRSFAFAPHCSFRAGRLRRPLVAPASLHALRAGWL